MGFWDSFTRPFKKIGRAVSHTFTSGFEHIGKKFLQGAKGVGKWLSGAATTIAKHTVQPVANVVSAGLDAVGLKEPLKQDIGAISDGITAAGNYAFDAVGGIAGALGGKQFGQDFQRGFEKGYKILDPFNPMTIGTNAVQGQLGGLSGRRSIVESSKDMAMLVGGVKLLKSASKVGKMARIGHDLNRSYKTAKNAKGAYRDVRRKKKKGR